MAINYIEWRHLFVSARQTHIEGIKKCRREIEYRTIFLWTELIFFCVALFFLKKYKTEIFISSMKYDKGDEKLLRKLIFFILFQSSEGERRRFFCLYS